MDGRSTLIAALILASLVSCARRGPPGPPAAPEEADPAAVGWRDAGGPAELPSRFLATLPVGGEVWADGVRYEAPARARLPGGERAYEGRKPGYQPRIVQRGVWGIVPLAPLGHPVDESREERGSAGWGDLPTPELPAPAAGDEARGAALYRGYCLACHGSGAQPGPLAQPGGVVGITPLWPDGLLPYRDEEFFYAVVRYGSPMGLSPPFGAVLDDAEIAAIMRYLFAGGLRSLALPPAPPAPPLPHTPEDLFARGAELYPLQCAVCHQLEGGGLPGAFPALAGNPRLADTVAAARVVRYGSGDPARVERDPYGNIMLPVRLSSFETAAVLTYARASWGNAYGPVTPAEVEAAIQPPGAP